MTSSPWTKPYEYHGLTVDQIVGAAYSKGVSFWWLDFWTVAGPAGDTDTDWYNAGKAARGEARTTILNAADGVNGVAGTGYVPAYVILDVEGYNTSEPVSVHQHG